MKKIIPAIIAILLVSLISSIGFAEEKKPRMLAHDVYFALKDNSEAAKMRLVKSCKKYLSDHPGTVWFDAAVLVKEHDREVNDRDFDVALHIFFKDKASHDKYQVAPKHKKFIEENKDNWKKVRVFDSWIMATAHSDTDDEHNH